MNSRTIQIFIFALLFGLATGGSLVFFGHQITKDGQELETQIAALRDAEKVDAELRNLEKVLNDTNEQRASLAELILRKDDMIGFLALVEGLAKDKGLEIQTRSIEGEEKADVRFNELRISFTVSGPDERVREMLALFETLPYHSRVANVNLFRQEASRDQTTSAQLNVDLLVTLDSYDNQD